MYYGKKTMVLWEKLWYDGKKYVTIHLYRKQWKFDILWKKLLYYTENYGNLIYYGKNYGTLKKNYGITENYR